MKFFVAFLLIAVFAASAVQAAVGELEPGKQGLEQGSQQGLAENLESLRIRKAARSYGGGSSYGAAPSYVPSVPCPKNYLFSCQPQLQPVACSSPSYGHAGSYSEPIPQWAALPNEN